MPDTLKDPGSRETTKPSRMKRLTRRLGKLFFPSQEKDNNDLTDVDWAQVHERARLEAEREHREIIRKGYKPGTIEHPRMPEGGRHLEDYEDQLVFDRAELEGKKVLDLGAGPELRLAKDIEEAGIDARVVSLSPDFADKKHADKVEGLGNDHVVAGLGQALPFKDGAFDEIFALHVAEHLPTIESERAVLREMARVLKEGGVARIGPNAANDTICRFLRGTDEELLAYFSSIGVTAELVKHPSLVFRLYDDRLGVAYGKAPAVVVVLRKGESDMSDASQRSAVSQ